MRTRPRLSLVVATVVVAAGLAYAASASTLFVPDSDTGTLVAILGNGLKQLAALNQQLGEVRKTYTATKTLVGYAADAANGFAALVRLDLGRLEQLFITAVPNAGFFDREARWGYRTWGQSTGELQLMIQQCMNFQEYQFVSAVQAAGQPPPPPPPPRLPGDVRPPPVVIPYDPCAILHLHVVLADDPAMVVRLAYGDLKADSTLIIVRGLGTGDVPPGIAARATVVVAPEGVAGLEAAALAWLGFWSHYCFSCAEARIEDWAQPGLNGRVFDWTEPSAGRELPDELRMALGDPALAAALWLHWLGADTGLQAYSAIYGLLRDTAGREDVPVAGAWTAGGENIERLCAVVLFCQETAPRRRARGLRPRESRPNGAGGARGGPPEG